MKRTKLDTKNHFNILTNDPSFTAWGWAVVRLDGTVLDSGCIKTKPSEKKLRIRKGDDRVQRISLIVEELLKIREEWEIKYIVSELPHGSQNAQAAMMIGATAAIVQTLAVTLDLGIEWYSEADAKKCLLGKQSASKNEMIEAVKKLYKVKWRNTKYIDEAVADAIAIYHTATKNSATLKFFK